MVSDKDNNDNNDTGFIIYLDLKISVCVLI